MSLKVHDPQEIYRSGGCPLEEEGMNPEALLFSWGLVTESPRSLRILDRVQCGKNAKN